MGADDAIPVRAIPSNSSKNLGFFRKKAAVFVGAMCSRATLAYRQRAMVETVNSMVKRNFLLFLIFAALLVVCVIFIFFPGTYENLLNFIPSK